MVVAGRPGIAVWSASGRHGWVAATAPFADCSVQFLFIKKDKCAVAILGFSLHPYSPGIFSLPGKHPLVEHRYESVQYLRSGVQTHALGLLEGMCVNQ